MLSKSRRRRIKEKAKKRSETVFPTQERMAKGNVVRLPDGRMKCVVPTFLDVILKQDIFHDEPDGEELILSIAFMMDLTERSGLFSSATQNISAFSFIKGFSNEDMSAADEWRRIVSYLPSGANITIVDLLSDPRPRDAIVLQKHISSFRELNRIVMAFRFRQKD